MIRTGHGPENKKKERPREGRSHLSNGRDDWIRTLKPTPSKQLPVYTLTPPNKYLNHFFLHVRH